MKWSEEVIICHTLNRIRVYYSTVNAPGVFVWNSARSAGLRKLSNNPLTPMEMSSSLDLGLKKPHNTAAVYFNTLRCIVPGLILCDAVSLPGLGGGTCFLPKWNLKKKKIRLLSQRRIVSDVLSLFTDIILTKCLADVDSHSLTFYFSTFCFAEIRQLRLPVTENHRLKTMHFQVLKDCVLPFIMPRIATGLFLMSKHLKYELSD